MYPVYQIIYQQKLNLIKGINLPYITNYDLNLISKNIYI